MLDKLIQLGIGGACLAVMYLLLRTMLVHLVRALTMPLAAIVAGIQRVEVIANRLDARYATTIAPAAVSEGACVGCNQLTAFACVDCEQEGRRTYLCPAAHCRSSHREHEAAISFRTTAPMRAGGVR